MEKENEEEESGARSDTSVFKFIDKTSWADSFLSQKEKVTFGLSNNIKENWFEIQKTSIKSLSFIIEFSQHQLEFQLISKLLFIMLI